MKSFLSELPAPLALVFVTFGFKYQFALLLLLIVLSVWSILSFPNRRNASLLWLTGAFFGPLAEVVVVAAGGWVYTNPSPFARPLTETTPSRWGLAALFFGRRTLKLSLSVAEEK